MKVGILGNKNKVKSVQAIEEMELFVQSCGYETVRFNAYNEVDGVDVVLVLGGDGAILHSAVYAARKNIKVIGDGEETEVELINSDFTEISEEWN